MVKIKLLKTGEVIEVTANVAHGLYESGQAEEYKPSKKLKPKKYKTSSTKKYSNRMLTSQE